jgi:hypothetical protein
MNRFLISLVFICLSLSIVSGQAPEKKRYQAIRVTSAPVINGVLDEEAWNLGEWKDDFIQNAPYNGRPATQRTEFKILFDDDNLYVAIKNYDTSPDSITKRLTRRDAADGDLAGIIVDSFHDLRTGFLFGVSSSGVKYDLMFSDDGQNEDESWDPNWWVKTSINKEGWVAEMKIPFSQVRFDKNSGDVWGLEIARVLYRKNETDFWQHIPADSPGFIHMMGELSGLESIKPRKILDITPYGVAKMETFQNEPGNPFTSKEKGRKFGGNVGLDAKIGITNNMTMDLTINPDFGQVEADPSEVNLSAYETYFSERRPFFIEGNNITNFNIGLGDGNQGNDNLFYSRRIGRRPEGYPNLQNQEYTDVPTFTTILGAAKLTGKTKNGLSLGFVEAVTDGMWSAIKDSASHSTIRHELVEPLTNYFLGRVQRDFNNGKTILGGIFTSTYRDLDDNLGSFMHKSASTGGIDFTHYFKDKNWSFNLNSAFSLVTGSKDAIALTQLSSARYYQRPDNDYVKFDPDRTSLLGSGGRMQVSKLNGHLNILACIKWKTPGFEINDLGYMQQADQMLSVIWAGYNVWEPKGIYRRYNINGDIYVVNNFGGVLTDKGIEGNASMGLKNYWSVFINGNLNGKSLSTGILRGGPMMKMPGSIQIGGGFSTDYRKKLILECFINGSKGFEKDYHSMYTQVEITYKPINFLSFHLTPSFSKSFTELQYVTTNYDGENPKYILASIDRKTLSASLRVDFTLLPDLTLQYWGQPYIASAKYYDYKYIIDPMADRYRDRYATYFESTRNRDFNRQYFLSNLVIRWEYLPGSTLYVVWSQSRNGFNDSGRLDYFNNMGDLFKVDKDPFNGDNDKPYNVFLIKFSYRFGFK